MAQVCLVTGYVKMRLGELFFMKINTVYLCIQNYQCVLDISEALIRAPLSLGLV